MADSDGDLTYSDIVATYLAFLVDKQADLANALNRWEPIAQCPRQLFARQAIPMIWDFAESNPLGSSSGSWMVLLDNLMRSFQSPLFDFVRLFPGTAWQGDATISVAGPASVLISTDPPYYDNVPYADLSDFFYIWLRRSIGAIYPELFGTLLAPKMQELVADPIRQGSPKQAEQFFEKGLGKAFRNIHYAEHQGYPVTIFYAFKQSEIENINDLHGKRSQMSASTGWETMLEGLLNAGFLIGGTWPVRTEMGSRMPPTNSGCSADNPP